MNKFLSGVAILLGVSGCVAGSETVGAPGDTTERTGEVSQATCTKLYATGSELIPRYGGCNTYANTNSAVCTGLWAVTMCLGTGNTDGSDDFLWPCGSDPHLCQWGSVSHSCTDTTTTTSPCCTGSASTASSCAAQMTGNGFCGGSYLSTSPKRQCDWGEIAGVDSCMEVGDPVHGLVTCI